MMTARWVRNFRWRRWQLRLMLLRYRYPNGPDRWVLHTRTIYDQAHTDVLKRADIVIKGVDRPGALNLTEILASSGWFNARRQKLRSRRKSS